MAIEKDTPEPIVEDMTKLQTDDEIDGAIVETLEALTEDDIAIQDDGSALLGPEDMDMPSLGFGENLAEVVSAEELAKIYSELTSAIENDKSAREDWEKTYTDGLKYLGMKFDEDRAEPFEWASGVIHPLLG